MVHTPVLGASEGRVSFPAPPFPPPPGLSPADGCAIGSLETQKHPDSRSLGKRGVVVFQLPGAPTPTTADGNRGVGSFPATSPAPGRSG